MEPKEETMSKTVLEVGKQLVELCRANKSHEAMETLYDKNIVSVEPVASPGGSREVKSLAACIEKGKQFDSRFEVLKAEAAGPYPHDDKFAVFFKYDVKNKQDGQRMTLDEIALYTVKDGKIVREEFFYDTPPGA
jgi:ketosteroid isomerase-like protein